MTKKGKSLAFDKMAPWQIKVANTLCPLWRHPYKHGAIKTDVQTTSSVPFGTDAFILPYRDFETLARPAALTFADLCVPSAMRCVAE